MKKKLICAALAAAVLLAGCGSSAKPAAPASSAPAASSSEPASSESTAPAATEAPTETPEPTQPEEPAEDMEAIIRDLFEQHLYCMIHIFELGNLPYDENAYDPENPPENDLVPVTSEEFKNYSDFEAYIRGIYSKEVADAYLYNFPYEGSPKYVNVDGDLYLNLMLCGGKGYYVDWSDYTVEINEQTDDRCSFTLHAFVEWPAAEPKPEDYPVEAEIVLEENGWRMNTRAY